MEREREDCEGSGRAPRVLRVDLGSPASAAVLPWRGSSPGIDRVGRLGGVALAAALLHEH